jgi:excinuclease ABC subunit A
MPNRKTIKKEHLDLIRVRGARQHNLKNVSVDIPKNKFVVVTGVSGSGKSSLAFDTIYAEGQRRYVESLSSYARQFLGVMDKPEVDQIDGLSPSISIDQKTASHNPRSTVGTITEIYDYYRLLFARIGHPHCPNDGTEIRKLSSQEIVDRILIVMEAAVKNGAKGEVAQFVLYSPIVREKKGEFQELFANLRSKGFLRIRINGVEKEIVNDLDLKKSEKHSIDAVIDSLPLTVSDFKNDVYKANLRTRIASSVEQALALSQGAVMLRHGKKEQLFSERFSCPKCGLSLPEIEPRIFSFNSPLGACEKCRGLGTVFKPDPDAILNKKLTINQGGIIPLNKYFFADTWYARLLKTVAGIENIDFNTPLGSLPEDKMKMLLYGTGKMYEVHGTNRFGKPTSIHEEFTGILKEIERRYLNETAGEDGSSPEDVQRYLREEICDLCLGKKLKPEVLAITIDGKNISDISGESIAESFKFFKSRLPKIVNDYERQISRPISKEIETRLAFLSNVGLSYLTIARTARTLSGGELQRIRLASQIGTGLTGVLYVLDEPSIGLHPRDVSALIDTLHDLKDLGNTLLVVEHDQETIESAEYVVELGPMAGSGGGHLTFAGTVPQLLKDKKSLTGQYLSGRKIIRLDHLPFTRERGTLRLIGASENNLKNVSMEIPLGNLVAVTGVSGSGKSTLVTDTLYPALKYFIDGHFPEKMGAFKDLEGYSAVDRVYLVDQSPIGRTPRSNPATYIGIFDEIRDIYSGTTEARARGFEKGRFSFNLKGGRCEKCQGAGVVKVEMQFLPDVYVSCDVCEGRRYNRETLEVKYKGLAIDEILKMTIDEGRDFFSAHHNIAAKLGFLQSVGLGYITLGQPAPTFSGGEAQRIKLADELSRRDHGRTVYILDEPTTGLHFHDTQKLLTALRALVERGNSVIIIEHNLDVIKNCQYIVDLGPEGGNGGGEILYQGELPGILKVAGSHTGRYLKKHIGKNSLTGD